MLKGKKELLESMQSFREGYREFLDGLENFERENEEDMNNYITDKYPFSKDLYEKYIDILDWMESIEEKLEDK